MKDFKRNFLIFSFNQIVNKRYIYPHLFLIEQYTNYLDYIIIAIKYFFLHLKA